MPTIPSAGPAEHTATAASGSPGPDDPGGASRPSNLRCEIALGAGATGGARDTLDAVPGLIGRAGAELGVTGEVRVRVVGDGEMALAHFTHCGVPGTTDVITMDLRDPEGAAATDREIDADLLVCIDEAARQAEERGHTITHELTLYILHGVLHCLGFDDHDDDAYAAMHAQEDRVLTAIGLGAVFGRGDAGAGI